MKNVVIPSAFLLAMLGAAGSNPQDPPKALTLDIGGGLKLELVLIPAGEFLMGSPNSYVGVQNHEKPQHRVRITRPFYLGKYMVTQEQWERLMGYNPSWLVDAKTPVHRVTWDECQRFVDKLNARLGGGRFALPTEAQWEYACRAGSTTCFCYGDDVSRLDEYAWYAKNAMWVQAVGKKKPNAWGLYDMHGNVSEWCADWYGVAYYRSSPRDDPTGPAVGSTRVVRGGDWCGFANACTSANRSDESPGYGRSSQGVRVSLAQ